MVLMDSFFITEAICFNKTDNTHHLPFGIKLITVLSTLPRLLWPEQSHWQLLSVWKCDLDAILEIFQHHTFHITGTFTDVFLARMLLFLINQQLL